MSEADSTSSGAKSPTGRPHYLRFVIPFAAFVVVGVLLGVGLMHSRAVGVIQSPLIGKPAPAWSLPLLSDTQRTFGSADLKGKWYVLNVWGTWCYACRDEHPELLAIARDNAVPIIGIDWMDDDSDAKSFLTQSGNPYTLVTIDHDGHVAIDWGVYGAPETFLVNPAGVVVFKQIGPITPEVWEKDFAARLPAKLLEHTS
ncbi:MAG: DsbE family thiol:disulfide interchange protein [Steroidobacteraceae bacterium]